MSKKQELINALRKGLLSTNEFTLKMMELRKEYKVFNLKCETSTDIYNCTIEALDINEAIEKSYEFLKMYKATPIAIWEV